jgi:hypothetical protein
MHWAAQGVSLRANTLEKCAFQAKSAILVKIGFGEHESEA